MIKSIFLFLLIVSSVWINLCYAQIGYTDLKPDKILIGYQSALYLDINHDSIDDYALFHDTVFTAWPNDSGMVNGIAHFNGNDILCKVEGHIYPRAILYNYLLDEQSGTYVNYENNIPLFVYAMVQGEYQNWGYFQKMTFDKYIGIKFYKDNDIYFGWIRIFIDPDGSQMICRDFAYNTKPNEGIYAGEGIPTGKVKNIVSEDVSDFGNGKDLKISFEKANDEFTVLQYRLYVVKAKDSADFNIQKAKSINLGNLSLIKSNGKDHELMLDDLSKDIDGDLIVENQEYLIYIVSYPAGLRSDDYQIENSNLIVLNNSSGIKNINRYYNDYFRKNNCIYLNGKDNGVDFTIYDLSGKVLKSYHNISTTVQVEGLKNGVYILNATENTSIRNYKIYIQE